MRIDMNIDERDFITGCAAVVSRVSRGTRVATQEGGNAILSAAQARCPIYSGTLRNSGEVTIHGSSANNYSPGFSAVIRFGGGNAVNPFTGKHPGEYAAAVHEGFAINPVTGEYSMYKSGEEKFLEKAVRAFEQTGLHRLAYKHWGDAIKYFTLSESYKAEHRRIEFSNEMTPGVEKVPVLRGGRMSISSMYSDVFTKRDFARSGTRQDLTKALLEKDYGIDYDTPGVTNDSLYYMYARHLKTIKQAHLYLVASEYEGVYKFSNEAIELAKYFRNLVSWAPSAGKYDTQSSREATRRYIDMLMRDDDDF